MWHDRSGLNENFIIKVKLGVILYIDTKSALHDVHGMIGITHLACLRNTYRDTICNKIVSLTIIIRSSKKGPDTGHMTSCGTLTLFGCSSGIKEDTEWWQWPKETKSPARTCVILGIPSQTQERSLSRWPHTPLPLCLLASCSRCSS